MYLVSNWWVPKVCNQGRIFRESESILKLSNVELMTIVVKSTTFLFSCGTSESKVCTDSLDIWRAQGPRVSFFRPSVFHTGNIWKHLETFFYTCMSDSSHSSHSSHSTGSRQWRRLLSVTESETLRLWDPYVYCTVATIVETEARYMLHACMTYMYDIHVWHGCMTYMMLHLMMQ
jgi:hypothetical protein